MRAHSMPLRKYLTTMRNKRVNIRGQGRVLISKKDVLPSNLRLEGFTIPNLDGPIRERNTDVVETGSSDSGKVLLGLREWVEREARGRV